MVTADGSSFNRIKNTAVFLVNHTEVIENVSIIENIEPKVFSTVIDNITPKTNDIIIAGLILHLYYSY
jgi:hypothetical protein